MSLEYKISCFLCGNTEKLEMFAHRQPSGRMVGWLFVCEKCEGKIKKRTLTIMVDMVKQKQAEEEVGK